MRKFYGVMLCLPLIIWIGLRIWLGISFTVNCGGHMERAGSANSIELARQEMVIVVKYADTHGMVQGYTSVLYNSPSEDVGFWYTNMKASLDELSKVGPDSSNLEKSNILIKLRETVTHHKSEGLEIIVPAGISIFPKNLAYAILGTIGLIMAILGAVLFIIGLEDD